MIKKKRMTNSRISTLKRITLMYHYREDEIRGRTMQWDIENYIIVDNRILRVEISVPLLDFVYIDIDDVKVAWLEMLSQFVSDEPGIDMSWEMRPVEDKAIVTIQIAKTGQFTEEETKGAINAVDALFDKKK